MFERNEKNRSAFVFKNANSRNFLRQWASTLPPRDIQALYFERGNKWGFKVLGV